MVWRLGIKGNRVGSKSVAVMLGERGAVQKNFANVEVGMETTVLVHTEEGGDVQKYFAYACGRVKCFLVVCSYFLLPIIINGQPLQCKYDFIAQYLLQNKLPK